MSNLTDKIKVNALYKNNLALVNTNSSLEYYDEVNIGKSYQSRLDVSNIYLDHIHPTPSFTTFTSDMTSNDLLRFGINITATGEFPTVKKYYTAYLDNTQTVINYNHYLNLLIRKPVCIITTILSLFIINNISLNTKLNEIINAINDLSGTINIDTIPI